MRRFHLFHVAVLLAGLTFSMAPTPGALAAPDIWTATGSLNTARVAHTATLLPNSKVLVAGGFNGSSGYLTSAEVYDPATGAWIATGPLNTARVAHTATLLPNGKVLVAGGFNGSSYLTSAEVYGPAAPRVYLPVIMRDFP